MKRNLSRFRVALIIMAVIAVAVSLFPEASLAKPIDRELADNSSSLHWNGCVHLVHFGETLSGIAVLYQTSAFSLAQANGLRNPNLIFAGMALAVPCAPVSYVPPCSPTAYMVLPGDDLFRIGLRFGLNQFTLAAYNGIPNPNLIFAGMRLLIPCSRSYVPPVYSTPAPQSTPSPQITPAPNSQVMVTIQNFAFSPSTITIRAGQTVIWRNNDPVFHTTTSGSCPGGVCSPVSGWDSGMLSMGQTFSHLFGTAGTFTYYCKVHGASMQGTVIVMP
jgi:plastocyanin